MCVLRGVLSLSQLESWDDWDDSRVRLAIRVDWSLVTMFLLLGERRVIFFLKIGEEMMQKWSLGSVWVSFSWERNGEDSEQSQKVEGKTKKKKKIKEIVFETQNTHFSWLKQVARASRQNSQSQNYEKFSKCFSQLEGLLARELWTEPQKSLCTPHDWTFHSWTSRQNQHASSRL